MTRHQETAATLRDESTISNPYSCPPAESEAKARTVIAHRDIRDDLLQHRLALDELLVLRLRRMQLRAEFLSNERASAQLSITLQYALWGKVTVTSTPHTPGSCPAGRIWHLDRLARSSTTEVVCCQVSGQQPRLSG